jgi:hypothetical protein
VQEGQAELNALFPPCHLKEPALGRKRPRLPVRTPQEQHAARLPVSGPFAGGPWWDKFRRLGRAEDSHLIDACAYALPRELGGLPGNQVRTLIREVAARTGAAPSSTVVERIADRAQFIDPQGRPLFAAIAALGWIDGGDAGGDRDAALRRLAGRTSRNGPHAPESLTRLVTSPPASAAADQPLRRRPGRHLERPEISSLDTGIASAAAISHHAIVFVGRITLRPDLRASFHTIACDCRR